MTLKDLESLFTASGGQFLTPVTDLANRIQQVKAFVFDWDGVFNNGSKLGAQGSSFSEIDSMGTNLMRYAYFLQHKQQLPVMALISGERNEPALFFSKREFWNQCYFKAGNKALALDHFCAHHQLHPNQIAYFFDDVLDLPIAKACGMRIMVNSKATILFKRYVQQHCLADYISANSGSMHAVRECTELCMGLMQQYQHVVDQRIAFSASYKRYLSVRAEVTTQAFTQIDSKICSADGF